MFTELLIFFLDIFFLPKYLTLFGFVVCSEKSKRRTKTCANTTEPLWNQAFLFSPIKESDFRERILEITVWDYDRVGASEFLGEVRVSFCCPGYVNEFKMLMNYKAPTSSSFPVFVDELKCCKFRIVS